MFTVNGGWGEWEPYGACTKTCGDGTRIRSRRCDNPPPSGGGLDCPGDSTQTSSCNEGPCPSITKLFASKHLPHDIFLVACVNG